MENIIELVPKLKKLIDKIESIRNEIVDISSIDYDSQDARMVALDSLQIAIGAIGNWISSFYSLGELYTNDGEFDEEGFLKAVGSGVDLVQTELNMINHLRLGFMILAHFKLDNLFHNILRHLNALPQRKGYWNLTNKILEECGIPNDGTEKDILTAFANLRNSLHGNGIHRTNTLQITIDELNFDFIKDERIECANWEHILVLLNSNIDILREILLSDKVSNIQTDIADDFASEE